MPINPSGTVATTSATRPKLCNCAIRNRSIRNKAAGSSANTEACDCALAPACCKFRLGGSGGDRPRNVGPELGEAQPILRNVQLRSRVVDPRLRRLQRPLRRIENRPRGEASLHQVVLAVEIVLRLDFLAARRVERRLRRTHAILLILRIELRQHLIRLDLVADPPFAR